jgi:hypothetical protein
MPGLRSENPCHADAVRVVRLDEILGAGGVGHRRLQGFAEAHHLGVGALATCAGIDAYLAPGVQNVGDAIQLDVVRPHYGFGRMDGIGRPLLHLHGADVAGHDQNGDAP